MVGDCCDCRSLSLVLSEAGSDTDAAFGTGVVGAGASGTSVANVVCKRRIGSLSLAVKGGRTDRRNVGAGTIGGTSV